MHFEQNYAEENASLTTLHAKAGTGTIPSDYLIVEKGLQHLPFYEALYLNDFAPDDRFERRKWFTSMSLSFPIMLYKYSYGNNLGTLIYGWKIPVDVSPDETIISRIFAHLTQQQSFYSSRAMRQDFVNKYSRLAGTPKMILRNIYRNLLHDSSAPEYRSEAVVDENVTKAVLQLNDSDIILDLR